jgi:hypothetical protein
MLAIGKEIRYRIAAILGAHWEDFFQAHKGWIRPVMLETVRKILACRTPALGCHVYACPDGRSGSRGCAGLQARMDLSGMTRPPRDPEERAFLERTGQAGPFREASDPEESEFG